MTQPAQNRRRPLATALKRWEADTLQKAQIAYKAGRASEADRLCRDLLARRPELPEALSMFAIIKNGLGDQESAEKFLRRAAAVSSPRSPTLGQTFRQLAYLLAQQGRFEEAVEYFQYAIEILPPSADLWFASGTALMELKRYAKAVKNLQKATKFRPDDPQIFQALGVALSKAGRTEKAIIAYREAVTLKPGYAEAHLNLGIALNACGLEADALASLERAADLVPNEPRVHFNLGALRLRTGHWKEAIVSFQRAVQLKPDFTDAHESLMHALFVSGQMDSALSDFAPAIQKMPDSIDLHVSYATALIQTERYSEAETVLSEARLKFAPNKTLEYNLGWLWSTQGQFVKSLENFEAALRINPEDPNVLSYMGRSFLGTNDPEAAAKVLKQALVVEPENQVALAYLALAYRLLGDEREVDLCGYDHLVREYELENPEGFADTESFNAALDNALDVFHQTKHQPLDQTLRGGTQSIGNLFSSKQPIVSKVRQSIETIVTDYVATMTDDETHPFFGRRTRSTNFAGSWSCRLSNSGYHTNHIHADGWISSAYYVALPDTVTNGSGQQGWLKFGEPDLSLPNISPRRVVRPEVGKLVLFPSYLFHGTLPFSDTGHRTTIAFDVVPS